MLALKRIYHQVLKVSAWNFTTSKIKLNPNKTHLNKGFCMVGSGVYPKGALDTDICNTGGRLVSPYLTVVGSLPYGVVFFSYTELYTIHILQHSNGSTVPYLVISFAEVVRVQGSKWFSVENGGF